MTGMRRRRTVFASINIMVALYFLTAGCAGLKNDRVSDASSQGKEYPPPIYYDFGDVRLPEGLKMDEESCFVYRTSGFDGGVLVLEGSVEIYSLIAFFEDSMANDNWKFISSFKSPRTIMLFQKESRWCVINITDKQFTTYVEIWVAPTIKNDESGLRE
jgi:hypothetical protein